MTEQDKTIEVRKLEAELQEARDFTSFLKEQGRKAALHNFLAIAAKSYIDGMQAAIKCQNAAQATAV